MTNGRDDVAGRDPSRHPEPGNAAALTRRTALQLASFATVAGGGVTALSRADAQTTIPAFNRLDHVYFVLNIHWLQAIMYSHAISGTGLAPDLLGRPAGTPPTSGPQTNFTRAPADDTLRTFMFRMLAIEITQIRTLIGIINALDGPGKIANLVAPDINYAELGIGNDGFTAIFHPLFSNLAAQRFSLTIEDHFLTVITHFKEIAVTAYQTVVAAVPGDTTFPAFMTVQSYQLAVLRDLMYERAKRPGSALFDISDRLARRGTTSLLPRTTEFGLASNIVPADDRGRSPISSYVQVLTQLVGPGQEKGLFFRRNFIGRINTITLNILG